MTHTIEDAIAIIADTPTARLISPRRHEWYDHEAVTNVKMCPLMVVATQWNPGISLQAIAPVIEIFLAPAFPLGLAHRLAGVYDAAPNRKEGKQRVLHTLCTLTSSRLS